MTIVFDKVENKEKGMKEENIDWVKYVEITAQLMDLNLAPQYQENVVENFARIAAIAQQVTEFPLPDEIEAAPIFEP